MMIVRKFYMFIAKSMYILTKMAEMQMYGNSIEDVYGLEKYQHILHVLVSMKK